MKSINGDADGHQFHQYQWNQRQKLI